MQSFSLLCLVFIYITCSVLLIMSIYFILLTPAIRGLRKFLFKFLKLNAWFVLQINNRTINLNGPLITN